MEEVMRMSNSKLATVKVPASTSNYTKNRDYKISEITIHHMAAKLTAKKCGQIFQAKGRQASTHYGIGSDGQIGQYVDEKDAAWANANRKSNHRAVTIEVANSTIGGQWKVSDKSLELTIKLVADIAKRNGIKELKAGKNLTWHSMYVATTCPGPYLKSKMTYIAKEANKILKETDTIYRVRKSWSNSKSQLGAFTSLSNAKKLAQKNKGYKVYDDSGKCVYNPWS
jgi:hypothetical protein